MLRAAGGITALIGTIEYHLAGKVLPAVNTTPESLDLVRIFAELERAGGRHATMEVSSHALALGRVYGLHFHTAVFTNLTRDHLDFHGTMDAYFAAKQMLFEGAGGPPPAFAVLNRDDEYARRLKLDPGPGRSGSAWGPSPICGRATSLRASTDCASTFSTARRASPSSRRSSAGSTYITSWRPAARRYRMACRQRPSRGESDKCAPCRGGSSASTRGNLSWW